MNEVQDTKKTDALFEKVSELIEQARKRVATAVNVAEVYTKYHIGQYIVEDEQQGEYRAQYGKQVLKNLSDRLAERFGNGWSYETLAACKKFFLVYSNSVTTGYKIQNKKANQRLPIGILLCESKNDLLVELTLPKDANVYATAYELCLPDKALLQAKVKEWIEEFEENNGKEEEDGEV